MNGEERALLNRILASRHFANAGSLKRILEYLCQQSDHLSGSPLKEYDIAVSALGRPSSFDPKTDPIIRVNIAGIRERLAAYFSEEAEGETLRLSIPKGQYRAVFEEQVPSRSGHRADGGTPALHKFWRPYLTNSFENTLLFSELLFFRDDHGNYLRNIYINDLNAGVLQLQQRFPAIETGSFRPTFHFISSGEVHCMLALTRMFSHMGVRLETRNSRFAAWNVLRESNLILLGSSRTNPFVDSLQGDNNFIIHADRIVNLKPQPCEETRYSGSQKVNGKLEKLTEYALVTQRPAMKTGSIVTAITANHGRAIEGAGDFMTTENRVHSLLEKMGLAGHHALPQHFQVLLRVEMMDFDEEVVQVEPVAHRILTR
jgi:hypothetical protein